MVASILCQGFVSSRAVDDGRHRGTVDAGLAIVCSRFVGFSSLGAVSRRATVCGGLEGGRHVRLSETLTAGAGRPSHLLAGKGLAGSGMLSAKVATPVMLCLDIVLVTCEQEIVQGG